MLFVPPLLLFAISHRLSNFHSLTKSNLDRQRPCNLMFRQKAMLSLLVSIIASCAIAVGLAFIVGRTVPSIPNRVCRFLFLFVLGVPMIFVINYVDVRTLGYHKMGRTEALIIALLGATWGTFWTPQPPNSKTP